MRIRRENACEKRSIYNTNNIFLCRIHADTCDRLWVLDTGTIGIGDTTVQACPYTLNVFDLNTDRVLRQYRLRPEDINSV